MAGLLTVLCLAAALVLWICISVAKNGMEPDTDQESSAPEPSISHGVAEGTQAERIPSEEIAEIETPEIETEASIPSTEESLPEPAETETAPSTAPTATQDPMADSRSLYEQFLDNRIPAIAGMSYPEDDYYDYMEPLIEEGTSCTLAELDGRVSKYFLNPEFSEKTSCDHIRYAYVACPDTTDTNDKNLLLKFVGLDIYSPNDDSYAVFTLTEKQGQLYITGGYQCWARSENTAYANGSFSGFGSSGAGSHSDELSVLLSDGRMAPVYEARILSGWWANEVGDAIYQEIFGQDMVSYLTVSIYTIGDSDYYLYDMSECTEEERPLSENYINRCRDELGINWVTEEAIKSAIQNRCAALGVNYDSILQREEPVWTDVR